MGKSFFGRIHNGEYGLVGQNLISPNPYDPTDTTHGDTGFHIKDSLVFKRRDDLKFNSSGFHESTFIEIILPNKKNVIVQAF